MKERSRFLSLPMMILVVGMCVCIALFISSLMPRSEESWVSGTAHKAYATNEIDVTDTKYMTSKTGDYIIFATAFSIDDVDANVGTYVLGYTIDGTDYNTRTYYEAIRLTRGAESVRYDIGDIFGMDPSDNYGIIALEIPYNAAHNYTYSAFVRRVTPGAGFPADLSDYETVAESAGTEYESHHTLATPVLSVTEDGISWSAIANATDYQVTVNSGSPTTTGGATAVSLSDSVGDYNVSIVALGDGGKYENSSAANCTYHVQNAAINVTSTNNNPVITWTRTGLSTKLSDDGVNFVNYGSNTVTTINSAPVWIKAVAGWDSGTNTLYKAGGANETVEYLAKVKDGNDLILETSEYANASQIFGWTKHKYASGWEVSDAMELSLSDDYLAEDNALKLKTWVNGNAYRYGKTMSTLTSDNVYKAVAFDIKLHPYSTSGTGNSDLKTTVQIMTGEGIYMNYNLNSHMDADQWYHVEVSLMDTGWDIAGSGYNPTNVPSLAFNSVSYSNINDAFRDISNIYFTTTGSYGGGPSTYFYLDNLELLGGNSSIPTTFTELTTPDPDPANLSIDFGTYSSNVDYNNASWTRYSDGVAQSGQMRIRQGDRAANNAVVNMYADTTTRKYAYNENGSVLGMANYFSVRLGNYFDNATAIQYKIVLVASSGSETYLAGGAGDNFATLAAAGSNSSYSTRTFTTLEYNNFGTIAVKSFYFVIKKTSGTGYMYVDDIILCDSNYNAPVVPADLSIDFGTTTSGTYNNASWTQYVNGNSTSGQMNAREGNTSGNAVVNMYADSSNRKYVYNENGSALGIANYFSIKLGNYYSNKNINYKIVIVDTDGVEHYLVGGAGSGDETYATFVPAGSNSLGSRTFTLLEFDLDNIEVRYFYIAVKAASGAYLYMDDIVLHGDSL